MTNGWHTGIGQGEDHRVRQVVLDTETTGLDTSQGHRIVEIGCVELDNRKPSGRTYQQYIRPDREIDAQAQKIHGITEEFLSDKPMFEEVFEDFLAFVKGAELIVHNAPFDLGFIDYEISLLDTDPGEIGKHCGILDTLVLAKNLHPGQKNSLDALSRRYGVDNSARELHGALLDAQILAEVYLAMTGGQVALSLGGETISAGADRPGSCEFTRIAAEHRPALRVIAATEEERESHRNYLDRLRDESGEIIGWPESGRAE